jgi:hypothetical protein
MEPGPCLVYMIKCFLPGIDDSAVFFHQIDQFGKLALAESRK